MKPKHKHVSLFTIPDTSIIPIEKIMEFDQDTGEELFNEYRGKYSAVTTDSANKFRGSIEGIAKQSSQAALTEILEHVVKLVLYGANARRVSVMLGVSIDYANLLTRTAKKIIQSKVNSEELQEHVGKSVVLTDLVLGELATKFSTEKNLKAQIEIAGAISDQIKTKDKLVKRITDIGFGTTNEESKEKRVLNSLRQSFTDLFKDDENEDE